MNKRIVTLAWLIFLFICGCMFWGWRHATLADVLSGDPEQYSRGAINILQHGFYSLDGIHPYLEREPGYSFFLAGVFGLFGINNYWAVFAIQAALYGGLSYAFALQTKRIIGALGASLVFLIACSAVSAYHSIFLLYREGWTLLLMLAFSTVFLSYEKLATALKAMALGVLFGLVTITYFSFAPFIVVLLLFLLYRRLPIAHIACVILIPVVMITMLVLRTHAYTGTWTPIASQRTGIMWAVRGEQAVNIHGTEPFLCLWSEYVSRNWTNRSASCSFNGVMHRLVPDWTVLDSVEGKSIEILGKQRIGEHFLNYLWFSVFEVLELHLPFLGGGWSKIYNLSAALTSLLLYCGIPFSWKFWKKPTLLLFVILPLYHTAFFALTDATPRYLNPILFCYVLFSAIGYAALIKRFFRVS